MFLFSEKNVLTLQRIYVWEAADAPTHNLNVNENKT